MTTRSIATNVAAVALAALLGCAKKEPPAAKPAGVTPGAAPAVAANPPPAPPQPTTPPAATHPAADPDLPDPKQTVSGTITVPAARKKNVKAGDTVFVIARRAGGPPGPGSMLATQKLQAGEFPMRFTLSSRDAMIPGIPFEGNVNITVRVDKDGDAMTRRKGDVFGQANDIKIGTQDVVVPLDTLQAEDQTLGGPVGSPSQGLPPGHP